MRYLILALFAHAAAVAQVDLASTAPHVQAELLNNLKAKKARVGDKVRARTVAPLVLPGGIAVPVSSTIYGRITDVANSASASSLTIAFDQIEVDNKKIPAKFSIRAAMLTGAAPSRAVDSGAVRPGDVAATAPMHGAPRTVQDAAADLNQHNEPDTAVPGTVTHPAPVAAEAGAVIGMPGVTLKIDDAQHTSKFESAAPDLELRSGLQLMLAVVQ